jgi:PAS domain S-box-containing protein
MSKSPKSDIELIGPLLSARPDIIAHYLASIVESSDDAIMSKDLNGTITSWNTSAERLFGYTADEALGKSVTMLIPADRVDEEPAILNRLKKGERIERYETVRRCKDGRLVEVSLSVSPIRAPEGNVIGAAKIVRDITERRAAEERERLLTLELQHRTQNMFTVIQAVAKLTLVEPLSLVEAREVFNGRLAALSIADSMLTDTAWKGVPLTKIIQRELAGFSNHLNLSGSDIVVNTLAARQFALSAHELATNAVKYGALSVPAGRVAVTFDVQRAAGNGTLLFLWKETGGPKVLPPKRKGFGSVILLNGVKDFAGQVALEYEPDGLKYAAQFPLSSIEAMHQEGPSA